MEGNKWCYKYPRYLAPAGNFVMIIDMLKGVIATSLYILIPFYFVPDNE